MWQLPVGSHRAPSVDRALWGSRVWRRSSGPSIALAAARYGIRTASWISRTSPSTIRSCAPSVVVVVWRSWPDQRLPRTSLSSPGCPPCRFWFVGPGCCYDHGAPCWLPSARSGLTRPLRFLKSMLIGHVLLDIGRASGRFVVWIVESASRAVVLALALSALPA